jgi:DnaJ-class molecular chaperone
MDSDEIFKLMGINNSMSFSEASIAAKNKYRQLVKEWHPDVNSDPNAAQKFNEIKTAYSIVTNREEFYKIRDHTEFTDSPEEIINRFWNNI